MTRRTALVPALAAALVPKCPFCVAAWLSLCGVDTFAAEALAPFLRASALGIAAMALGAMLIPLARASLRSGQRAPLLVAAGASCLALAPSISGTALPWRLAAVVGLALAWSWADRRVRTARTTSCCGGARDIPKRRLSWTAL
jgi:hypothetical protein